MDMRWFISDTHFGHAKIIEYCGRPFSSVDEMDMMLWHKWNECVKDDDEVFFLGDFGFGSMEYLRWICSMLNGRKVCIRGNHDRSATAMKKMGFDVVLEAAMIRVAGEKVVLQHEPPMLVPHGCFVLHGHTHDLGNACFVKRQMSVCVELWDYKPVCETVVFKHVRKALSGEKAQEDH